MFTLIRPLFVTLTNCDLIGMSSQRFRKFPPWLSFQNWRQVDPTAKRSRLRISGFYYFVFLCFIMSYHETGTLAIEVLVSQSLQKLNYVAESRLNVILISGNMQWNIHLCSRSKPTVTWYYWDIKVLYTWIGQPNITYMYMNQQNDLASNVTHRAYFNLLSDSPYNLSYMHLQT